MIITETKRLIITEATLEDCSFFYELMNSQNWLKYIGDRGINNYQDAEEYIQKSLIDSYKENGFGLYKVVLKDSSVPIGLNGFVKRNYLDYPDIGFAILPQFEGLGYTQEAGHKLLEHGSKKLGMDPILGITSSANFASQHLLLKIGLSFEKKIKSTPEGEELLLYSTRAKNSR